MNENKESKLLNNKEFIKKIQRYKDLYYTLHEINERGRFNSFYECMERYCKILITDCLEDLLDEIDEKFSDFMQDIEIEFEELTEKLKQEYKLTDDDLEDFF